jgi:hypothetical protein
MRNRLIGITLMALALVAVSLQAKKPTDPEADLRAAMADAANVLVILYNQNHLAVFPVSGISEVTGLNVTIKAGTFVIHSCQSSSSPKKLAEQLLPKWKSRKGDNLVVVKEGGMMAYTFFFGELKEDKAFTVEKVILVGKPK